MKSIAEVRGLRFPDDYVVKMFFKEGLHKKRGRVVEFGCGSGNNLILFASFGWNVTGVDHSAATLADARHNLEDIGNLIQCDLTASVPAFEGEKFDAVLLPSVNYYIPRTSFERLLRCCREIIVDGGIFFIRSRLPDDWRFARGKPEGHNAFRLDCAETGEKGMLNVFYTSDELAGMLHKDFADLQRPVRLTVRYENQQGGQVIGNSDVVIWGAV
jgi:SAM-dependent methyltransferase